MQYNSPALPYRIMKVSLKESLLYTEYTLHHGLKTRFLSMVLIHATV